MMQETHPENFEHMEAHVSGLFDRVREKTFAETKQASSQSFNIKPRRIRRSVVNWAAAAIIFLSLGFGAYLYITGSPGLGILPPVAHNLKEITPGTNKAVLILASGRKIMLDEAADGQLAQEAGIRITKTKEGLVYEVHSKNTKGAAVEYNTIETPRGGQYKVILPDGSIVWLNAASSLRYPLHFAAAERRVELAGEAYFAVKSIVSNLSGVKQPFIVGLSGQQVKVLGTQFNINAYADEVVIKTTLVEGKVNVSLTRPGNQINKEVVLKPGEQSTLMGNNISVAAVDVEEAIAWKDGLIVLNNVDLATIIRQIERWYNVKFELPADFAFHKTLSGELQRDLKLSDLLRSLEINTGLHFIISSERRIMITK